MSAAEKRTLSDADLDALADALADRLAARLRDRDIKPENVLDEERLPVTEESMKRAADRMMRPRKYRMR